MTPIKLSSDLQRKEVIAHFLSLPQEDLRLRFGYSPTNNIIEKYVNDSWGKPDNDWYGMYVADCDGIVATLHIAQMDHETVELGLTVSNNLRRRGNGDALFKRGITWAKARGVKRLFMHCLTENVAVQRIAKKNGMHVVRMIGGEAEADLALPYDPTAIVNQILLDNISVYDMVLVNQLKFFNNIMLRKI